MFALIVYMSVIHSTFTWAWFISVAEYFSKPCPSFIFYLIYSQAFVFSSAYISLQPPLPCAQSFTQTPNSASSPLNTTSQSLFSKFPIFLRPPHLLFASEGGWETLSIIQSPYCSLRFPWKEWQTNTKIHKINLLKTKRKCLCLSCIMCY